MNREKGYKYKDEKHFMALALAEAEQALAAGDYPVGAVLTLNGELLNKARNSLFTEQRWTAHAEHNLIYLNSENLLKLYRNGQPYDVCLYTTLEPCLMCLGIAMMHRVSKIIYACPDPHGGAANVDPERLGSFYPQHWPSFEMGTYKIESCDLIVDFLKQEKSTNWKVMLDAFQMMQERWRVDNGR